MKRATHLTRRVEHLLARIRFPRLPDKVELPYGGLVRTGFWLLAFAWFWTAGARTDVAKVFRNDPDYIRTQQIAICRSYRTPSARGDCVTRFLVSSSNEKFYRVAVTFLPPLLLVPLCGVTLRRMGRRAQRKLRILPL